MKQKSAITTSLICLCLCLGSSTELKAQIQGAISIEKSISSGSVHELEKVVIRANGLIKDVLVDSSSNCVYLRIQNVKDARLKKEGFAMAID
jgi:hypothetical protein